MSTYDKEIIARYEEGDLPEEERRQFETELQQDPALAEELALYREIKATLQDRLPADGQREALIGTLHKLRPLVAAPGSATGPGSAASAPSPTPAAAPTGRVIRMRWISAVAAACIVGIIALLVWPSGSGNLDRLGRTEMVGTTERGDNTDSLMQQAAVFFNNQQFGQALPLLDKAVNADSTNQLALFYRGVARWHTGAVDPARKDLQQVYDKGSVLKDEAAFFMALGFATEKNTPAARQWLDRIPQGSPVSAKAKELSDKLK